MNEFVHGRVRKVSSNLFPLQQLLSTGFQQHQQQHPQETLTQFRILSRQISNLRNFRTFIYIHKGTTNKDVAVLTVNAAAAVVLG